LVPARRRGPQAGSGSDESSTIHQEKPVARHATGRG